MSHAEVPPRSAPTPGVSEALARGTLIGRYVVLEALGRGGMGVVYAAYDPQLERRVAIKVLHAHLLHDETRARFLREAQALARLSHPNVVAVHDVGDYGQNVFIAMEYVAGRTLRTWLKEAPRSWRDVSSVMREAGRGLAAAHAAGIVHRDVKPDNVLIADGGARGSQRARRVVVTDFGLARAEPTDRAGVPEPMPSLADLPSVSDSGVTSAMTSEQLEALTDEGGVLGTVGYMSPEQAWGDPTDARSDQWSFCATLYYALYGEPPIRARTLDRYIRASVRTMIEPPAARGVPAWLRRVLKRGLSRNKDARYASMEDLLAALARDPRATWRRAGVIAALAATVGGVALVPVLRERAAREACADGEKLAAATWDDRARDELRRAFSGSGAKDSTEAADRVVRVLDGYARQWSGAHVETCEAARVRRAIPEQEMYVRFACLERRRTELGALVQLFARADAQIVDRAMEAAYGLVPPSSCNEPGALKTVLALPSDPTERAHVLAARIAIADADSLAAAGKVKDAIARAEAGLAEARASRHRGSEAEALLHIGQIQESAGVYETAIATYASAVAAAESAGDDATLAQAAARLAFIAGDKLVDADEAARWLGLAHAALDRLGPNDAVEVRILQAHAPLPTAEGKPEEALPLFERLLPITERLYGAEHPTVERALNNLGFTQQMLGRHEEALANHKKSIDMLERTVGAEMPSLAIVYSNVGSSLIGLGRYVEARAAIDHATAIAERSETKSFWRAWALQFGALAALRSNDSARALEDARRGIAIAEARGAPAARLLPALLTVEGRALIARGDAVRGEASCRRALEIQMRRRPPASDRVYDWDALGCVGEALLAQGKAEAAIGPLEQSVGLPRRVYAGDLAVAKIALARALVQARRDPARARALLEDAIRELSQAPGRERERADAERALAAIR